MDTPSLFMIPSAVSSGKVHSVFPNSTDADFDFNRDSDATRVNSEGLIERVGYYGSDLVTNGDFSNGSTGWGLGSNWSVSGGKASCDGSASNSMSQATVLGIASTTFKITYNVSSISQGSLRITLGGVSGASRSEIGTYTDFITASSTDRLRIFADSNAIASIDNIVVNQVTGDRARLNYEIEGGLVNTKPSLLLEPQSTNLVTYSQDFSQWSTISASATDDYATSPEGITNASRFLTTSTGAYLYLSSISVSNSTVYTISVYAKSNGNNLDDFRIYTSLGDSSTLTATSEWQRFTYTFTTSVTSINIGFRPSSTQNADIQVFGYQLEQQSYSTSYIPTNGSTQTRAAETCNGAGTSSILPSEEGILYCEIAALADDLTFRTISVSDGTTSNRSVLRYGGTSNFINVLASSGGSNVFDNNFTLSEITDFNKIAIKYKLNNYALWVNGNEVKTDTSGAAPVGLSQVQFSNAVGNSNMFYGKIRDIRVYNTKEMTDSEVDILLTKITS